MRRFWEFLFLMVCAVSWAQDRARNPYLIPPAVYVGDRATLVVPLPGLTGQGDISRGPSSPGFPSSPDMDIHRIVLERRPSGGRLLIEFSAFTTGFLELPPVEIGNERFTGLRVEIRSLIGSGEAVLSPPAAPLAMPGTGLLVYGTMAALALLTLTALWFLFWGRRRLGRWLLKWKRWRLIISMRAIEKRLRRTLLKGGERREILDTLSAEFRIFLAFYSGENCRAMTPAELGGLRLPAENAGFSGGDFLASFFRGCDRIRFSGKDITDGEVLAALGDLGRFLEILEKAGREKPKVPAEAA